MQTTEEKPTEVIGTNAAPTPRNEAEYHEARFTAARDAGRKFLFSKTEDNAELRRLAFNLVNRIDDRISSDELVQGAALALGVETFGQVMRLVYGALTSMNDAACAVQPVQ